MRFWKKQIGETGRRKSTPDRDHIGATPKERKNRLVFRTAFSINRPENSRDVFETVRNQLCPTQASLGRHNPFAFLHLAAKATVWTRIGCALLSLIASA